MILPSAFLHQPMHKATEALKLSCTTFPVEFIFSPLFVDLKFLIEGTQSCERRAMDVLKRELNLVNTGDASFAGLWAIGPYFGFDLNAQNRGALECRHSWFYSPFNRCH